MDGAPADGLVDSVEERGEGFFNGDPLRVISFFILGEIVEIHAVDVVGHCFLEGVCGEVSVFCDGFAGDGDDAV